MLTEKVNPKNNDIVFVYTTCRDEEEARGIAFDVIEKHLAACSDFWPIRSIYPWQGVIQEVDQCMLVLTTQKRLAASLMKHIEHIHSYSVPVIAECDVQIATQAYRFWIEETLERTGDFLTEEEARAKQKFEDENGYHPGKLK